MLRIDTWRQISCAIIAGVLLSGCEPTQPQSTDTSVVDSAGVRIVTLSGSLRSAAAQVTASRRPMWRSGWRDEEPTFERIRSGYLLADGGAVVADQEGRRVYVFAADGQVKTAFGRRGEGPGEFRSVDAVAHLPPDSIVVTDGRNLRVSVHSVDGAFQRSFRWPRMDRFGFVADAVSEGRLLYANYTYSPEVRGNYTGWRWIDAPLLSSDRLGEDVDTLMMLHYREQYWEGGQAVAPPFAHHGMLGGYSGGWAWASNAEPSIHWYSPDGTLSQVFRWIPEKFDVTDEVWSEYVEAFSASLGANPETSGSGFAARFQEMIKRQETLHDGTLPIFSWLVVGSDGSVWMAEYTMPFLDPRTYLVVSADGMTRHRVKLPQNFRVLDVLGDRILGVWRDELDIEAVAVLRAVRSVS